MSNQFFSENDSTASILGRIRAMTAPENTMAQMDSAVRNSAPEDRFELAVRAAMAAAKATHEYVAEGVSELERRLEVEP